MAQQTWERRTTRNALVGVAGAGGAVLGTYLPWFRSFGEDLTGWDIYDIQNEVGDNPFFISEFFESNFDPFFTGGATLGLGVLIGVLAVIVLNVPKHGPPSRLRVHPGLFAVMAVASVAALLVAMTNLFTVVQRPDEADVSVGFGFWLTMVALLVASGGLLGSGGASRAELQTPPETTTAVPTVGGPAAAGWYPDPAHRHQMRYWDGTSWTPHVADAGQPSEDAVVG